MKCRNFRKRIGKFAPAYGRRRCGNRPCCGSRKISAKFTCLPPLTLVHADISGIRNGSAPAVNVKLQNTGTGYQVRFLTESTPCFRFRYCGRQTFAILKNNPNAINSKQAKTCVIAAREIQTKRFAGTTIYTNSQMKNKDVKKFCVLSAESENILKLASDTYNFSARSYIRIIKVARTIADLDHKKDILPTHIAEALQYKQMI